MTISVHVELWMSLRPELLKGFRHPSVVRSTKTVEALEGMTVGALFRRLAQEYPVIAESAFDIEGDAFSDHVTVTLNQRVVPEGRVAGLVLADGDTVIVMPVYAGG